MNQQPSLFRKKPVVIEAVQIDKRMDLTSPPWWADAVQQNRVILRGMGKYSRDLPMVEIQTLEGVMTGVQGDWIIRGVQGELYPCKPDIFAATYEPVGTPPASAQDDAKDERQAFEAWAVRILGDNPTWRESGPCELAWQAWQARASVAAPAAGDARALLDHPLLRDVLGYIEDAGPADVWGAAQSWMALRDAALAAQVPQQGEA